MSSMTLRDGPGRYVLSVDSDLVEQLGRDIAALTVRVEALSIREETGNTKEQLKAASQCLSWARDHVSRARGADLARSLYRKGYAICQKCGTHHDQRRRCPTRRLDTTQSEV